MPRCSRRKLNLHPALPKFLPGTRAGAAVIKFYRPRARAINRRAGNEEAGGDRGETVSDRPDAGVVIEIGARAPARQRPTAFAYSRCCCFDSGVGG